MFFKKWRNGRKERKEEKRKAKSRTQSSPSKKNFEKVAGKPSVGSSFGNLQQPHRAFPMETLRLGWSNLEQIPPAAFGVSIVGLVVAVYLTQWIRKRMRHFGRKFGDFKLPPVIQPPESMSSEALVQGMHSPDILMDSAFQNQAIFQISGSNHIYVANIDVAKEILQDSTCEKNVASYTFLHRLAGGPNIATSEGDSWKANRKSLSVPLMKNYMDRLQRVCKDQTERWIMECLAPRAPAGISFDARQETLSLTLAILSRSLFEYSIPSAESEIILKEARIAMEDDSDRSTWVEQTRALLSEKARRASLARSRLHTFARRVLKAYRAKAKKSKNSNESLVRYIVESDTYQDEGHRERDIVMILISSLQPTASTLAWIFYELAANPDEYDRLRGALRGKDVKLAHDVLNDVVKETMRLHPATPHVGFRKINKDIFFKKHSVVIPKDSVVALPSILLSNNCVDNASDFLPSRWQELSDDRAFFFSMGPRSCPGQGIAMAQLTYIISRVCSEYGFELVEETDGLSSDLSSALLRPSRLGRDDRSISSNPQTGSFEATH